MNNFCTNCGSKLSDNMKFCAECGQEIKVIEKENLTVKPQPIVSNIPINNIPINNNSYSTPVYNAPKQEKRKGRKIGLLGKIASIVAGVLVLLIVIGILADSQPNNPVSLNTANTTNTVDGINAMNKATGLSFYNLDVIPCIETDHEFNEIYIPYIMRGLAIKYKEAQLFNEIIWSTDYMESVSFEQWQEAMGIASENWAEIEAYSEEFSRLLETIDFTDSKRKTSIEFFTKVYAEEKINKEEAIELLKLADENKIDPVKMLTANMNISAEKAKKFARIYWNKDTTQKIAAEEEFNANVNDFAVKGLKTVEVICKGVGVYGGVAALATTTSMVVGTAILVVSSDTILSMGEDVAYYLFDNNEVGGAIAKFRERSTKHIAPYAAILTLNPTNLKDNGERIGEIFNTAMVSSSALIDLADKGVLEIDLTGSEGKGKVYDNVEELKDSLKGKGVDVSDTTLSQEDYEKMKKDNSWLDADDATKKAFEQMRELEKINDEVTDEEYEEVMELLNEIEALYDENIKGTENEIKIDIEKKPVDATPTSEPEEKPVDVTPTSEPEEKPVDATPTSVPEDQPTDPTQDEAIEYVKRSAERMGYAVDLESTFDISYVLYEAAKRGYKDIAEQTNCLDIYYEMLEVIEEEEQEDQESVELAKDMMKDDAFLSSIWAKLESMNSIDENVIDEIMSDIVWNLTGSLSGKLSIDEIENIFKERDPNLYKQFEEMFINERNRINNPTPTPTPSDNQSSNDQQGSTSNDSSSSGTGAKAEKEFLDYQNALAKYNSLAEGEEKERAWKEAQTLYQIYMNALKK